LARARDDSCSASAMVSIASTAAPIALTVRKSLWAENTAARDTAAVASSG
jgi:hypothetical protein